MTKIRHGQFGYHAYHRHLPPEKRLAKPCSSCPFVVDLHLGEERMAGIKFSLSMGQPFWCHKTVYQPKVDLDRDNGAPSYHPAYRMCEGAARWLEGTMQDGSAQLGEMLGVKRDTVLRWLRRKKLPEWVKIELRKAKQAFFIGRKSSGAIDLIVHCHEPQLAVLIVDRHGPDKVICFEEVSAPRFRSMMLDVQRKLAPQWRLR